MTYTSHRWTVFSFALWILVWGSVSGKPDRGHAATNAPTKVHPVVAQAEAGWGFIQAGDYHRAMQVFSEASRQFPGEASLLVGLGLSQSRLAHYDRAVATLNRALALNAEIEHAHALLGDLYFKRDDLDASIRHYEVAARQDPADTAVQDGLDNARRAYRLEAPLHRVRSRHFVVKFESSQRKLANETIDRLERLDRVVGRRLGWTSDEVVVVILYSDARFKEFTGSPAWAGGLYDGKIHLASRAVMKKGKAADAALAHEYTHAVVHRLSAGRAPTWLQEGLALYFEGRPAAWSRDVLARRRDQIIPLHALHGSFLGLSPGDAELAYAEGDSATRAMIDQFDVAKVRQLLQTLASTSEFAAAFEAVFQIAYRDFEAAWTSRLTGRRA